MSETSRAMRCPPEAVFDVLDDGWLYPSWVVGAARLRAVDESWPYVGAKLHHSVGTWPALINDDTEVTGYERPYQMGLRARAWPAGEAQVEIRVEATPNGCTVTIVEAPVAGAAARVPRILTDLALDARNRETLQRLAYLAEGRAR